MRIGYKSYWLVIFLFLSTFIVMTGCSSVSRPKSIYLEKKDDVYRKQNAEISHLFNHKKSGATVETGGIVQSLLKDDEIGTRHQKFILKLATDQTLLISHNIDSAPRIPNLRVGDEIIFRGKYEWNEQGGIIHWTHYDPKNAKARGWIVHDGKKYQ